MKLKFSLKRGGFFGGWTAEMSAPFDFSSPRNFGRLASWDVLDGGVKAPYNVEGGGQRTSHSGSLKKPSLRLVILEAVESKTFDFDFQNVPLP
jgi:hypothetical protein